MHKYLYLFCLAACCTYAWSRGGIPERAVALILGIGSLLTLFVGANSTVTFAKLEVEIMVIDLLALAGLIVVALIADRYWTLVVAALQLVGILGHIAILAQPDLIPWAYAFVLSIWGYPMLIVLAVGTWRFRRREADQRSEISSPKTGSG